MKKKHKLPIALLNTFSSLLLRAISIVSGFIIPKLILDTFGSETNGLVSSISQFLNYINLIEGGLNGVIMASYYKPLTDKNNSKISAVYVTSRNFLRKISFVFLGYSLILSIVYPLFTNSNFSYPFILSLVLILSIKLFTQYCFSLADKNLLDASKHGYVVHFTHATLLVVETIATFILIKLFPNIHIIKLVSAIIYFAQPIIFNHYIKNHFNINLKASPDKQLIKDRWNGFAINVAAFIHSNTDIVLLTIMTSLKTVSVYSVYALVSNGIRQIIKSISDAIAPSIGHLYAKGDINELNIKFDLFEFILFTTGTFMFGMGIMLVTPFVMLYTKGVTDTNYYEPIFGIILLTAELISCLRGPAIRLGYGAGKFKDMRKAAFLEAGLNIIISITLVPFLGVTGVAIGTLIAMLYRTSWQYYYIRNHLINRPFGKFIKRSAAYLIPTSIVITMCLTLFPIAEYTISNWIYHAIIYGSILAVTIITISIIFYRNDLKNLKKYLRKRS